MTQVIEVPGMGEVEFPDDMSDDAIASAIKANMQSAPVAPPATPVRGDYRDKYAGQNLIQGNLSYLKDYIGGIGKAATQQPDVMGQTPAGQAAGVGEAALHLGSSALAPLFALPDWAITKLGIPDERNPSGTYAGARDKYVYEPRTESGKQASNVAGAVLKPVSDAFSLIGSGYGDAAGLAGASPEAQNEIRDIAPDVVSAGIGIGALKGKAPAKPAVPTVEELGTQAKAAYKRAEDAGIAVSPQSFDAMKMRVLDKMEKEGIDKDLHPKSLAAMKRLTSTEGPVTLEKIETLRKIANDARSTIDKADGRLAGELIDDIDDFVEGLTDKDLVAGDASKAAALKEARGLYSRKKKAEEIDELVHRAELSAPNFSASGMENALRTEFRSLAKNSRRMRRFNAEERAAIEKVAKGDLSTNALRLVGKLAPTGAISGALSGGVGFAIGGPVGAAAVPAAGLGARLGATQLTKRAANSAQELMRRGPAQPAPAPPAAPTPAPAAGLLGSPVNSEAARRQELMQLLGLLGQ